MAWTILGLLVLSAPVAADEYNYHTPFIGERSVGMGGAATAVADDASASYYNPAGLSQTRLTSLSLSATVVQFRMQEIENFLGPNGVDQWSLSVIAASWSWATDLWGGRFALSLYVPEASDFELDKNFDTDLESGAKRLDGVHLIRRSSAEELVGGLSMAWGIGEKWAVGFSLFGSYKSFNDLEDNTFFFDDDTLVQSVDTQSGGLVGVRNHVGVLFRPIPQLHIGLSVRLGFHFVEWADWRRLRVEGDEVTNVFTRFQDSEHHGVGLVEDEDKKDEVELKDVQGGAIGVAWQVNPDLLLALDLSLWSAVTFKRLGRVIEKEPVANVAIGGEYRIAPEWPMRFGLFTNLSSAPDIDQQALDDLVPSDTSRLDLPADQVDFFGASISLGNLTPSSTLDVALVAMVGFGDRVELLETGAAVHDILDWQINLTISGSYIFEGDPPDAEQDPQERLEEIRAIHHQQWEQEEREDLRRQLREQPSPWKKVDHGAPNGQGATEDPAGEQDER